MNTRRRQIECDFVARGRPLAPVSIGLLVLGAVLVFVAIAAYENLDGRRSTIERRLAALHHSQTQVVDDVNFPLDPSIQLAAQDLATPWTLLLAELERASKDGADQVAILSVEPDHSKHSVLITAEARTLPLALAYVKRLQASRSIQYPMLDRHELRADDPQHPVRFEMTGHWRDQL